MRLQLLFAISTIVLVAGCFDDRVQHITANQLEPLIDSNIVLVDVRTWGEYELGHIPNAVNFDCKKEDFINKMEWYNKNSSIYLYCKEGGRSERAGKDLIENGYAMVYSLDGGFDNWKKMNKKIVK